MLTPPKCFYIQAYNLKIRTDNEGRSITDPINIATQCITFRDIPNIMSELMIESEREREREREKECECGRERENERDRVHVCLK